VVSLTIALVTDSTACLPAYRVQQANIEVVPVHVVIDDQVFSEGLDITSQAVITALREGQEVSTTKPNPEAFADVYRRLRFQGVSEIISIHLSSELSGTYSAAVVAARESDVPVRVVDSRTVGLGLGFTVLAAADAIARNADFETVAALAHRAGRAVRAWLCVDNVDHLRRGGRIGFAQATVGAALSIKPILEIAGGKVIPREKVRTTGRSTARLVELCVQAASELGGDVEVGVQHAGNRAHADALSLALGRALPGVPVVISDLGAVLSAHAGPGAVAVVVAPIHH
jgi:DegV family protein with EDD domain